MIPIPDFWMIVLWYSVGIGIGLILIPLVWEVSYKSKLVVLIVILGLIFFFTTSIHRHSCKPEYVKSCEAVRKIGLGYNYCSNTSYERARPPPPVSEVCLYDTIKKKCKDIPNTCLDITKLNIDGYCISFLPLCFLFNQP